MKITTYVYSYITIYEMCLHCFIVDHKHMYVTITTTSMYIILGGFCMEQRESENNNLYIRIAI